jgi:PRTRC genetic system protein A
MDETGLTLVNARLAGDARPPAPLGTYILARHFVLLEAEREEYRAAVPVSIVHPPIDSLPDERPSLQWKVPRPPLELLTHSLLPSFLIAARPPEGPHTEALANLVWNGLCWSVHHPEQEATIASVHTADPLPPGAVVQVHSHGRMKPFWSPTDNADEQGFLIYVVVGCLGDEQPGVRLRVGINGHWLPLRLNHVFTC